MLEKMELISGIVHTDTLRSYKFLAEGKSSDAMRIVKFLTNAIAFEEIVPWTIMFSLRTDQIGKKARYRVIVALAELVRLSGIIPVDEQGNCLMSDEFYEGIISEYNKRSISTK